MVVHKAANHLKPYSSFLLESNSGRYIMTHWIEKGLFGPICNLSSGKCRGECLCSFVLFKHAYRSLLMSVQWSGRGEGKEIREEQIGDSHHKRQSPPVPDGELQSLLLREGPQSEGSRGVRDLPASPQSDTGGEARGTCWGTWLLYMCVLSGCKGKVSHQVVYKTLKWVSVDALVRRSCQ